MGLTSTTRRAIENTKWVTQISSHAWHKGCYNILFSPDAAGLENPHLICPPRPGLSLPVSVVQGLCRALCPRPRPAGPRWPGAGPRHTSSMSASAAAAALWPSQGGGGVDFHLSGVPPGPGPGCVVGAGMGHTGRGSEQLGRGLAQMPRKEAGPALSLGGPVPSEGVAWRGDKGPGNLLVCFPWLNLGAGGLGLALLPPALASFSGRPFSRLADLPRAAPGLGPKASVGKVVLSR